jgi:Helicase conserved C-terminal domain
MSTTTGALPPILFEPTTRCVPAGLEHMELNELRKKARVWVGADQSRLPRDSLVTAMRRAMEDDKAASRVLDSLSPVERAVAAVYRRYGGSVDGEVIRLDLMARGLLEIIEERHSDHYTARKWKSNPVRVLADSCVLISERPDIGYYYSPFYDQGPDQSFERYSLHAGVARLIKPAGPPSWSIPPAEGVPQAATITRRTAAEVALDLSRAFAHIAGRGSVKIRKDGLLSTPVLRAMEKAVPLDKGSDLRLPDPHGFYFELLRQMGAVRIQGSEAFPDPAAATRQLGQSSAWQANLWVRGWLSTYNWFDGYGTPKSSERENCAASVQTGRQVLAWALGCLARAGDRWYDLTAFIEKLYDTLRHVHSQFPFRDVAWNPRFPAAPQPFTIGPDRQRASWFIHRGVWFANAVMVTLVTLGLVERARLGGGPAAPLGFRLTELGRAVFGAPEIAPPPEPEERRCLVIQPNFDIVAYLDQADAPTAGLLGRLAESGSARSGPIQTFRLTQASVYQAEENGLSHAQIVDFLQRHSQRELAANVLRSLADWSGKRESLALRSGVTVLGFPTTADRDAYRERHAGTACGERFVLVAGSGGEKKDPPLTGSLVSDHLRGCRRTLELDEQGWIRTTQPVDLVQSARLHRIARPTSMGWQLTADSMRQAAAGGLKPGVVHRWLQDHLARPAPPLIAVAIDAWLRVGRSRPLELADAVVLHVPDGEQFKAIATSRRLRPFLLGRPGPGWLVVKKEVRRQLAAALEELGFTLSRELTQEELPAVGKLAGAALDD